MDRNAAELGPRRKPKAEQRKPLKNLVSKPKVFKRGQDGYENNAFRRGGQPDVVGPKLTPLLFKWADEGNIEIQIIIDESFTVTRLRTWATSLKSRNELPDGVKSLTIKDGEIWKDVLVHPDEPGNTETMKMRTGEGRIGIVLNYMTQDEYDEWARENGIELD